VNDLRCTLEVAAAGRVAVEAKFAQRFRILLAATVARILVGLDLLDQVGRDAEEAVLVELFGEVREEFGIELGLGRVIELDVDRPIRVLGRIAILFVEIDLDIVDTSVLRVEFSRTRRIEFFVFHEPHTHTQGSWFSILLGDSPL
jgi:hypothetical protein